MDKGGKTAGKVVPRPHAGQVISETFFPANLMALYRKTRQVWCGNGTGLFL